MFVIQSPLSNIHFQNDIKDIQDYLYSVIHDEGIIKELYHWLNNAEFGDKIKISKISIYCIPETKARKFAQYYGVLPEFEKTFGCHYGIA